MKSTLQAYNFSFKKTIIKLFIFITLFAIVFSVKIVQIAIIGTNDIHGSAFPTLLMRSDTNQTYKYGGLQFMGRLIEIIQHQYPNRSIYLDAGDQFQGGIQSSSLISSGMIMNDFYDTMGLEGAAIGNHQFDFGPDFLFPYYQNRKNDNIAANLRSQNNVANFMPKQKSSKMFVLDQGIKIGVIGLATLQTPSSTAGFSKGMFPPYKFLQYRDIIYQQAKYLRENGADAVLILGHVGNDCPQSLNYGIWTKDSKLPQCPNDEITNLIDALPPGTIDAIVQGHRHRIVHHFHKGVPFMGTTNGGYYLNVMYIKFQVKGNLKKQKKISNITIEGPIPVCQKIFSNNGRCNYLKADQLKNAGELIPWNFHKQQVYAHPQIKSIYQNKWMPKMAPYFEQICKNEVYLQRNGYQQNDLGNLLTNLIHESKPQADFVIVNYGSFRTIWLPGVLQYQHVYGMSPFSNEIWSFKIFGSELKQVLKVIQEGNNGFYQTWNLQTTVNITSDQKGNLKKNYVNGCFFNETQFDDDAEYTGLSIDFLLTGGDDFKDVINKVYTPRGVEKIGDLRQTYKNELKKLGVIKEGQFVDPEHPRLIVNINN